MLEARSDYGYGGSGITDRKTMEKFQVWYRCKDGSLGEIGWRLFKTESEAEDFAREFSEENSYVASTFVRHPAKCYSTY